jgi:hypothetical protein
MQTASTRGRAMKEYTNLQYERTCLRATIPPPKYVYGKAKGAFTAKEQRGLRHSIKSTSALLKLQVLGPTCGQRKRLWLQITRPLQPCHAQTTLPCSNKTCQQSWLPDPSTRRARTKHEYNTRGTPQLTVCLKNPRPALHPASALTHVTASASAAAALSSLALTIASS